MVRCIDFINGVPTSESLVSRKSKPSPIPWSHPFIERLIGTIRRECLDQLLFWTATDLETKLIAFRDYYNRHRTHAGLKGETPIETMESKGANLKSYCWQPHCRGLYQTPIAYEH